MLKIKTKLTPVRYPGGKSNALKFLSQKFIYSFDEYREPFFGGGSVGLYLMQTCKSSTYKINDLFFPVYSFWKTVYESPNEMIKVILDEKNKYKNKEEGIELHKKCKELIHVSINEKNCFNTACLWYILNKTSYSGMAMIGSYAPLAWDQNFTINCINNLIKVHELMKSVKSVEITNLDYSEMLSNTGDNVFIFLDPPYDISHSLYGNAGDMHKGFNHEKFSNDVKKCNHKWMITYNENPTIKSWFSDYNMISWDLKYTMKSAIRNKEETVKSGKIGKELLISNYCI